MKLNVIRPMISFDIKTCSRENGHEEFFKKKPRLTSIHDINAQ